MVGLEFSRLIEVYAYDCLALVAICDASFDWGCEPQFGVRGGRDGLGWVL